MEQMPIVKTGTFRQCGFTAARKPDGSFLPPVRLWIEETDAAAASFKDMTDAFARLVRPLFDADQKGEKSA